MTGLKYPTFGNAFVDNVNIIDSPIIGYCPQFDALALELTGRETLMIFALLSECKDPKSKVEKVLWCIQLKNQADKFVRHYRLQNFSLIVIFLNTKTSTCTNFIK